MVFTVPLIAMQLDGSWCHILVFTFFFFSQPHFRYLWKGGPKIRTACPWSRSGSGACTLSLRYYCCCHNLPWLGQKECLHLCKRREESHSSATHQSEWQTLTESCCACSSEKALLPGRGCIEHLAFLFDLQEWIQRSKEHQACETHKSQFWAQFFPRW